MKTPHYLQCSHLLCKSDSQQICAIKSESFSTSFIPSVTTGMCNFITHLYMAVYRCHVIIQYTHYGSLLLHFIFERNHINAVVSLCISQRHSTMHSHLILCLLNYWPVQVVFIWPEKGTSDRDKHKHKQFVSSNERWWRKRDLHDERMEDGRNWERPQSVTMEITQSYGSIWTYTFLPNNWLARPITGLGVISM